MYSTHCCPRCSQPIALERVLSTVVVCQCGWTGSKSQFETRQKKPWGGKKLWMLLAVLALGYLGFQGQKWGRYFPEYAYYQVLSGLKMTTAAHEARMAFVCKKLDRHQCAAEAYTKALAKSPKSYSLAGTLGIELTQIKEFDRAIFTFQNFFSHQDGTDLHKQHYARALSAKEYIEDATEWYYQALQDNPKNFQAAQELIDHLYRHELHVEALSLIGHYNTLFPETRKDWGALATKVKKAYRDYNDQYNIKEIKIAGLNKYLHAPVRLPGSTETQLFLVDPGSEFLTLDLDQLKQWGVPYESLGTKTLQATNGREIKGTQVILSEFQVGPFLLKNVKGVACENCAFLLGKDILKRLNFKTQENKGIKYITLKQ